MTEKKLILRYRTVGYPPDSTIPPTTYSKPSELFNIITRRGNDLKPIRQFNGLIQIEFIVNGEHFLFPDFDNIFSRPDSVRGWWFLTPEVNGEAIYQSDADISAWWNKFQDIYKSSILSKKKSFTHQLMFLALSSSNGLVELLSHSLLGSLSRLSNVDEKSPFYHRVYSYNFFRDYDIEEYWRVWLWKKATIHYYHVMFYPKLLIEPNEREILRLSNRFPEYASAVRELDDLQEELYNGGNISKKYVDKFFSIQSTQLKKEVTVRKREGGGLASYLCQCRVCGVIFPVLKIQGKNKQICPSSDCEKSWDLFRKSLPPNPSDQEGGFIHISQL